MEDEGHSKGKSDIWGTLREDYPQKEGRRASPKPLPLACSDSQTVSLKSNRTSRGRRADPDNEKGRV